MPPGAFAGQVVLITGASSGIGRAGRLMVLANRFAPGLFDAVARRMIHRMARRPEP